MKSPIFSLFLLLTLFPLASFASGTLTVINSEIATSTTYGIYGDYQGTLKVASSSIHDNGKYGIYGDTPLLLTIATSTFSGHTMAAGYVNLDYAGPFITNGNTATNNARNGFIVRGTLANDQTFQADIPYVASSTAGNITVNPGKTLTVNEQAIVKFDGTTARLDVTGTLNALSSSKFTSIKDDVRNDTNNDGTSTSPTPGDWERISFLSGSTGSLTASFVFYGGSLSTSGMISNSGGTVNVDKSFIEYSKYRGLYNSSGTLTSTGAFLHTNDIGLYHSGGTTNIANNGNRFSSSTSYGIYNSTGVSLNAEMNFWVPHSSSVTTTGAYHATLNPSGNGDTVSNNVDFTPWKINFFSGSDAVDGTEIRWDGTTAYWSAWYGAMATWNAEAKINIATDTVFTLSDLTLSDVDGGSASWVAQFTPDDLDADDAGDMKFNNYYMGGNFYSQQVKQLVATHELGHALGLYHSYIGNVMFDYPLSTSTAQTSLGLQDLFDYHSLWGW